MRAQVMHETFAAWAKANGETVWTMKGLGAALRERGFVSKASDGVWWVDVRLVRGVADIAADQPGGAESAGDTYPGGYGGRGDA